MIKEFKDFIMKGNVLDLAIAFILAGAFGAIVNSFTQDILLPPIGLAMGGVDFSDLKIILQTAQGETPEVAIRYGVLLNTIINFLIVSIALFMLMKAYNKMNPPAPPAPPAPAGPSDIDLLTEIRDLLKK
jgi:large conductance mechanosensitive channel